MTEQNLYIVRSLSSGFLSSVRPYYPDLGSPHLYAPERFVAGTLLGVDVLPIDAAKIMLGRREQMPRRDFYLADDHETLEQYKHGLEIGKLEILMSGQVPFKDLKSLAEKLMTLYTNLVSTSVGIRTKIGIRKQPRAEANEAIRYIIQTHFRIDSGEQK